MDKSDRKNAIGVAFSGGGLQGIAHIGAIQALYELGIHPQYVSGTSSGAAMAAIFAMGMTPNEMRYFAKKHWKTLAEIDNGLIFKALATFIINKKVDKDGIKDGQLIADVVKEGMLLKGIRGFRDLPINLSVCTVDTLTTDECIFTTYDEGLKNDHIRYLTDVPLEVAVRASMSFPAIYQGQPPRQDPQGYGRGKGARRRLRHHVLRPRRGSGRADQGHLARARRLLHRRHAQIPEDG